MRLLFVYNADDGLFNKLTDAAHKLLDPASYDCGLCYYTFGTFGMLRRWRDFVAALPVPVEFLYRDAFRERYGEHPLPGVFCETGDGRLLPVVPADDLYVAPEQERGLTRLMEAVSVFVERNVSAPDYARAA